MVRFPQFDNKDATMALLGKMVFKGKSGRAYRFRVYPFGTRLRKVSGVYIVGNRSQNTDGVRDVVPLFVGHTADFSEPFTRHSKAGEFTGRPPTVSACKRTPRWSRGRQGAGPDRRPQTGVQRLRTDPQSVLKRRFPAAGCPAWDRFQDPAFAA